MKLDRFVLPLLGLILVILLVILVFVIRISLLLG